MLQATWSPARKKLGPMNLIRKYWHPVFVVVTSITVVVMWLSIYYSWEEAKSESSNQDVEYEMEWPEETIGQADPLGVLGVYRI